MHMIIGFLHNVTRFEQLACAHCQAVQTELKFCRKKYRRKSGLRKDFHASKFVIHPFQCFISLVDYWNI